MTTYYKCLTGLRLALKIYLLIFIQKAKKIDNHWRAHGDKRNVNKILPYNRSRYTQSLPNGSAYSKNMPFNKVSDRFHLAKIQVNNDFLFILKPIFLKC